MLAGRSGGGVGWCGRRDGVCMGRGGGAASMWRERTLDWRSVWRVMSLQRHVAFGGCVWGGGEEWWTGVRLQLCV